MPNSENKHGRSRHNYRLSHQTQISRNCQFLGEVFQILQYCVMINCQFLGEKLQSRHHSFFVSGQINGHATSMTD